MEREAARVAFSPPMDSDSRKVLQNFGANFMRFQFLLAETGLWEVAKHLRFVQVSASLDYDKLGFPTDKV